MLRADAPRLALVTNPNLRANLVLAQTLALALALALALTLTLTLIR